MPDNGRAAPEEDTYAHLIGAGVLRSLVLLASARLPLGSTTADFVGGE